MARRNRNGVRKEKIIMLTSSVLVLSALTVTGIFVRGNHKAEKEDYVVDFGEIEKEDNQSEGIAMSGEELDTLFAEVGTDDLDYDPSFQEANSDKVENTEEEEKNKKDETEIEDKKEKKNRFDTKSDTKSDAKTDAKPADSVDEDEDADEKETEGSKGILKKDEKKESPVSDKKSDKKDEAEGMFDEKVDTAKLAEDTEALSTTVQPALDFSEEEGLVWPIVGDVLINYSMDKTVYFQTLEQYRYNPAIVIAAPKGETITAAADGKVTSVSHDPMIGNMVVMDLGNGYELTYGQLENITVSEGSYVSTGDSIGNVASPTEFYCTEGSNVYFKLMKDGEPINPMSRLQ